MEYTKTKYPNIFTYETTKGKRYYIRRSFMLRGKKKEVTKSGLKSLGEARAYLTDIEKKIDEGEFKQSKNLTLDQYWDRYYAKRMATGQWRPDTENHKVKSYYNHFSPRYGQMKIRDLDREEYEGFIAGLLKTHARKTVRELHGIFMAILNDAVNNGYLLQNTLQKIFIGESAIPPKKKEVDLEEFKIWDAKAREVLDDYEYLIVIMPYFSLRASEVNGLKLKNHHIRPDGLVGLKLRSSRTRLRDDDADEMKTDDSKRLVVLSREASALYLKVVEQSHQIAQKTGRILGPEDLLLLNHRSTRKNFGKKISCSKLPDLYEKISQITGIHITPHMMRHFYATQGVIAGVSIEHMAAVLGHSTSYMTEKYTHIKDEVAANVTEVVMKAVQ